MPEEKWGYYANLHFEWRKQLIGMICVGSRGELWGEVLGRLPETTLQ